MELPMPDIITCNEHFETVLDMMKSYVQNSAVQLQLEDFYLTLNGKIVDETSAANQGEVYRIHMRLRGGKGGFGSMLKAVGAKISKNTNKDACRDLGGRRIRDVNNEKALRDWLAKEPEREREKKEKEEEKKNKQQPKDSKYFFDSTDYDQKLEKIRDNSQNAIKQALKSPLKRKAEVPNKAPVMRNDWFGEGFDDSDSDDDDTEAKKPKLESNSGSTEDGEEEEEMTSSEAGSDDNDGCKSTNEDIDAGEPIASNDDEVSKTSNSDDNERSNDDDEAINSKKGDNDQQGDNKEVCDDDEEEEENGGHDNDDQ